MYKKNFAVAWSKLSFSDRCFIDDLVAQTARNDMKVAYAKTVLIARKIEKEASNENIDVWKKFFPKNNEIGIDLLEIMVREHDFDFLLAEELLGFAATQENNRVVNEEKDNINKLGR